MLFNIPITLKSLRNLLQRWLFDATAHDHTLALFALARA